MVSNVLVLVNFCVFMCLCRFLISVVVVLMLILVVIRVVFSLLSRLLLSLGLCENRLLKLWVMMLLCRWLC